MGYTLKPSNYVAKPWFLHFTAQKPKCPRRFWEIDPEILHTCLVCTFYDFFFFFSRWKCGIPQDPIFPKIQNPKYLAKKKEGKKIILKRLGRGCNKHVCNIQRRGHWTLKEFGVLCLNQRVRVWYLVHSTSFPCGRGVTQGSWQLMVLKLLSCSGRSVEYHGTWYKTGTTSHIFCLAVASSGY